MNAHPFCGVSVPRHGPGLLSVQDSHPSSSLSLALELCGFGTSTHTCGFCAMGSGLMPTKNWLIMGRSLLNTFTERLPGKT